MGKREEITDLFAGSDAFYTDKEKDGKYRMYKGKLLKFSYEGSIVPIVITRIDRKNKRVWGEHVELGEQQTVMSHFRHNVDSTVETMAEHNGVAFCTDCGVPVNQPSTEDGEVKAADRRDRTLADGTPIE